METLFGRLAWLDMIAISLSIVSLQPLIPIPTTLTTMTTTMMT
jgi:hypothetical protein